MLEDYMCFECIKIYDMVCRIGRVCWRVCGVGG